MRISLSDSSPLKAAVDLLVIGVRSTNAKKEPLFAKLDKASNGLLARAAKEEGFEGKAGQSLKVAVGGRIKAGWVVVIGLPKEGSDEDARTLGHRAVKAGKKQKTAAVVLPEISPGHGAEGGRRCRRCGVSLPDLSRAPTSA